MKEKILGLNAAKLFDVDPKKAWKAIKTDKLTQLREEYRQSPAPSNTQYGWVWEGDEPPTARWGRRERKGVDAHSQDITPASVRRDTTHACRHNSTSGRAATTPLTNHA